MQRPRFGGVSGSVVQRYESNDDRSWRHPNLDHRLGVRRMISEARLLIRTRKAGLSVPSVWDLDYEGGQLIIEHLGGRPLIDVLNDEATTDDEAKAMLRRVGASVRRLHRVATTHVTCQATTSSSKEKPFT